MSRDLYPFSTLIRLLYSLKHFNDNDYVAVLPDSVLVFHMFLFRQKEMVFIYNEFKFGLNLSLSDLSHFRCLAGQVAEVLTL